MLPPPAHSAAPATSAAPASAEPDITVVTKPPLRARVSDTVRNASVDYLNTCVKAIAAGQYDAGMEACRAATRTWDGNHLAWYALASAHIANREWPEATAAIAHAVAQRPDRGMYQLYQGLSLYEAAQAHHDHPPPAAAAMPWAPRVDGARDALRRAIKLAPELWRAHYYLGRVYRDAGDDERAAEQFTQTIKTSPGYLPGYLALIELYRRWECLDQAVAVAVAVARLGIANVAAAEAPDLWLELGMAYDAKHAIDQAIEAYGKAIVGKPDDPTPKLYRAQPIASQLLTQIAKRHQ